MINAQEWLFIASDGNQYGPYSAEQLKSYAEDRTIVPETLVWTDGLEGWIAAGEVEGLFPAPIAPVDPAPAAPVAPMAPQFALSGLAAPPRPKGAVRSRPPSMAATIGVDQSFVTMVWGLRVVFWGFLIKFLASLAAEVLTSVSSDSSGGSPDLIFGVLGVVTLGAMVAEIIGVSLCFRAPRDSVARGLLAAVLVLVVIPWILAMVDVMFLVVYQVLLGGVFSVLGMILFVLYLKRVAVLTGKRGLELRSKSLAVYLTILIGMVFAGWALIALIIGGMASGSSAAGLGGLLGGGILLVVGSLLFLVMYIVALCIYLRLLQEFRADIRRDILSEQARIMHGTGLAPGV